MPQWQAWLAIWANSTETNEYAFLVLKHVGLANGVPLRYPLRYPQHYLSLTISLDKIHNNIQIHILVTKPVMLQSAPHPPKKTLKQTTTPALKLPNTH